MHAARHSGQRLQPRIMAGQEWSGGKRATTSLAGGDRVPGILALSLDIAVDDTNYGVRQWLGADGQVLASAIHCSKEQRGGEGDSGVLLGRGWRVDSDPKRPCQVPAVVMQAAEDSGIH